MSNKILLIEDEGSIRKFIRVNFQRNNFYVTEAASGEEGIEKAKSENIDVVILDLMLPGIDGFKTCELLRSEFPNVGIIMLTARSQDMDKIMGLEFGADDYMVKPFNPSELIARTRALLRRIGKELPEDSNILVSGDIKLDTFSMKVYKNNVPLDLTPKEYLLVKTFIENKNKPLNRNELLNIVWGYDYFGDTKIVDVNIRRIREKVEDNPSAPIHIETVWGIGYRWI
ncbi:DNA-binding response regulator, OmpR family, contains REC and winged-helix (wHTH) domain [Clostridium amylolyticum]|uniref:Stage 0 sporulation protein A homolog n=1 Tax=Clostridium amylolyticum TaxID=1121298 RepID=A0A1M6BQF5_9CLOT|nr:response regulator transcription factor [Clostridium amylolyticum]SHI50949.1 DNA-binding response regulator, OmpR family, contains REC and winged-helix (wHTH) domain [Clostridium amylolyticum]